MHIQIPPTGYVGLILRSTDAGWSTMRGYADPTGAEATAHAACAV